MARAALPGACAFAITTPWAAPLKTVGAGASSDDDAVCRRRPDAPHAGPATKLRVGVLGATGAVGQRFVHILEGHPWFELTALGASERSIGKAYESATTWQVSPDIPAFVRGRKVAACSPSAMPDVDFVFSALVSSHASKRGG